MCQNPNRATALAHSSAMLIPSSRSANRVRRFSTKNDKFNVPPPCDSSSSEILNSLDRSVFGSFDDLSELAFYMELENPCCNNISDDIPRSKGCYSDVGIYAALDMSCQLMPGATEIANNKSQTTGCISAPPEMDKDFSHAFQNLVLDRIRAGG
eukprot:CAMPEP_0172190410 /NCGR_PEP_ID=MMETSP1050-20130122/23100_1 /TAXON_ID=233186 /ORGANISM="Cryptomonas curvata, Strain CCAP979/52" /LENGTH=153 /DNA_ID=CAMNT_0012865285 /DNA_START=74 /DNA_END=531 /DNA_ORIENTATION=-